MKKKIIASIGSFRLRTLPLSVSGVVLGILLASREVEPRWMIVFLLLLTTISLQILSNLSNELGDAQKGTDNENRLGPLRGLQNGIITTEELKYMIYAFLLLSATFGLLLLYASFGSLFSVEAIIFLLFGVGAMIAALLYTLTKHAFGYKGLGDIFVFIFFGLVSVVGSYLLMGASYHGLILLPATTIGLLSTGVLNVNNIRDIENDKVCGKNTIPVRIGASGARIYHVFLIIVALASMILYKYCIQASVLGYLFLLTAPFFVYHLYVMLTRKGKVLDSQLKYLSITTLVCAFLSGIN